MGASNHPGLKYAKGKSRAARTQESASDRIAKRLQVYHEVSVRDEFKCRCCGRKGSPHATSLLDKLHHDHLVERSLGGEDVSSNLALLCSRCHDKKTAHLIEPEGNPDAGTLVFVMARVVAYELFRGRRIPAHVRILEEK